jgi:hypothetical protein
LSRLGSHTPRVLQTKLYETSITNEHVKKERANSRYHHPSWRRDHQAWRTYYSCTRSDWNLPALSEVIAEFLDLCNTRILLHQSSYVQCTLRIATKSAALRNGSKPSGRKKRQTSFLRLRGGAGQRT